MEIQDCDILRKRGLVKKPGPRHNQTDCEHHFIYKHIPTGEEKEFHGTLYDREFREEIKDFVAKFPEDSPNMDPSKIIEFYNS